MTNEIEKKISEYYPQTTELIELQEKSSRMYSLVVGVIEAEILGTPKKEIQERLGIVSSYYYWVKSNYAEIIKKEVEKLKQIKAQSKQKPKARDFFREHEVELAFKLYSIAMTGAGRESVAAAKYALDTLKDHVQEPPDFSRKMQAIIYNVFYPEDPNKPQIVEKGELSTDVVDVEASEVE